MAAFSPVHTIGNQLMEVIQLHQPVRDDKAKEIAVNRLKEVGVRIKAQWIAIHGN